MKAQRFIRNQNKMTIGYQKMLTASCPTTIIAIITVYRLILMTNYAVAEISEEQLRNRPLELGDIMPEDRRLYDKMRPPKYKGNATEVLFHVTVMSLDTIDESSMTYTCDVFFAQSWKDNRLRLPDNMTSEYRLLPIEWLTEIWRPDSFFKNAKDVTFQTMTIPNHYIWLWKDKTILYMVKLTLVLSCPMHFKNYPHDTQECNLEIESISHTTDDLIFIWDPQMPLDVDKGIELPQLELISTKNDDCTTVYSTGKFTCLEVVFKFKRRLGYYLFHTYVPTCLIVIMSWISFWIKPEAVPARVTLGVTSLLTLSTQHANSQKSLPPVSYIKAIDVFMSGCTVFVFLSLMEYALVNIVMGDIADIEKKKSMGISNLILGGGKTGGPAPTATAPIATYNKQQPKPKSENTVLEDHQKCPNHIGSKENLANLFSNTANTVIGRGNNPPNPPMSFIDDGFDNPREEATSTGVGLSVGGLVDSLVIGGGSGNPNNSPNIGHTCGLASRANVGGKFDQLQQSSETSHSHYHNQSTKQLQLQHTPPTNVIPLGPLERLAPRQDSHPFYSSALPLPSVPFYGMNPRRDSDEYPQRPIQRDTSFGAGADTTYFINPDGVMETVTTEAAAAATEAYGSHEQALASSNCLPPPVNDTRIPQSSGYASAGGLLSGENGTSGPGAAGAINNVISQQGIKNLVHDVQLKRQREIRDMMKKKREKAVLVDRISRWLFPTSFILLNIVYWALFGDHELW